MGKNSNIDWTDHTWNPWQGCRKVSPGCANCYMFRDKKRYGQDPATVIRSKPATFNKPLSWQDPAKVFVCSWSDFFIEDADQWRDDAWEIMRSTPHLTYQLLTKRPENIKDRLPDDWLEFKNIQLGVTVENQEQADRRIPLLFSIPSDCRFLSCEPLIEPIELKEYLSAQRLWRDDQVLYAELAHNYANCDLPKLHWVICGGESGANAREMHPYWAEDIALECLCVGVPFFMKQMSGNTKTKREAIPEYLQVREFPRGL